MIKAAFVVIGLLWLAKRAEQAKKVEASLQEVTSADPYTSVTFQWDALNGKNLTADGTQPNAHPAFSALRVGNTYPSLASPCVCK